MTPRRSDRAQDGGQDPDESTDPRASAVAEARAELDRLRTEHGMRALDDWSGPPPPDSSTTQT